MLALPVTTVAAVAAASAATFGTFAALAVMEVELPTREAGPLPTMADAFAEAVDGNMLAAGTVPAG